MARLEIDIALNNLQGATNGLKNLQDSLKQLSGKGVKIDVGANSLNEMKASLIANKVELEKQKVGLIEVAKAGKELDNQNKVTRNSIAQLTEESKRYNLEQKKLRDEQKASKGLDLKVTGEGSIVAMRTRLNELRKVYDNLSESARNSAKVQNNLVTEINRINKAVSTAEQATGRFQRNVGNYSSAMGNASGVTMEFNRIIQDAPFGMMGIGNNIQQLAANWQSYVQSSKAAAAANGTTIGTMGLLKGVMASMLTPANLLTLGIAVLTSAITAIGMASGKSAEEAKTLSNEFSKQSQALKNIISLSELHAKTERDKATAVSLYNKELGDTLGKVQSYSELEQKLIKSGDNYIKYLQMKAMGEALYQKSLAKTALMMDTIEELNRKGNVDIWGKIVQTGRNVKKFFGADINDGLKEAITTAEQLKIAMMPPEKAQKEIEKYTFSIRQGLYTMLKAKSESSQLADQWAKMEQSTNSIADQIGGIKMPDLNIDKNGGVTRGNKALEETIKLVNNYLELLKEINSISGLGAVDYATLGKVGIDLEVGKVQAELNEVIRQIEEYKDKVIKDTTISESQRTNLIAKANADREILEGRHLAKMAGLRQDYTDRIEKITVAPVKPNVDIVFPETKEPEVAKELSSLTKAIKAEINNIINMLPNLSGGFSDIFKQLTNGLNDILQKALVDRLGEMITNKMKELDESTQMIAGSLAIAGKTLQGLFSQKSEVGQGIGGALSGASTGLGIGSMLASTLGASAGPWGAAIGGVVGLVSGIFGAKKQKKQEELQRKQLEEQKKANALLERMNALAYTSSIIGGQSQYGIISGVNRAFDGSLVATVSGRDLQFVLDNNSRYSGR